MEVVKQKMEIDLNTPEFTAILSEAPLYVRKASVEARRVSERELIRTILQDGTVETERYAEVGDMIVTNPGGEQYVIKQDHFAQQYAETDEPGNYRSTDGIRASLNPTGGPISITAPWGSSQFGESDCFVAMTVSLASPDQPTDVRYIIGADEFDETYELAEQSRPIAA